MRFVDHLSGSSCSSFGQPTGRSGSRPAVATTAASATTPTTAAATAESCCGGGAATRQGLPWKDDPGEGVPLRAQQHPGSLQAPEGLDRSEDRPLHQCQTLRLP